MSIVAIRHGESTFNKLGLIQGHSEKSILTEDGRNQVIKLIPIIKDQIFDIVYVSDLNRTVESWDILSPYIKVENTIFTSQLREQYQGLFEGLPYKDKDFQLLKQYEYANNDLYKQLVEEYKTESISIFRNRIDTFFSSVDVNKSILCITHGGVIESKIDDKKIENGKIYKLNI